MSGRGRGRGRGRGAVPPSVASAPFNFGKAGASASGIYSSLPEPSQKFPDILIPDPPKFDDFSDFQLKSCEYSDKIDNLMRISPSFRPTKATQSKIDRYSDRYLSHANEKKERISSIKSNPEFFPEELHSVYTAQGPSKLAKKKGGSSANNSSTNFKDTLLLSQLDALAQKEESSQGESSERGENDNNEDEDKEGLEDVEDEEFEDETDYNHSYFDDGEDHGDYDDGNDEAVF